MTYLLYNTRRCCYDLKLFSQANVAEAKERAAKLNKLGPKGWILVELEDF